MLQVLGAAWALLIGMLLLMIGNGLQGTLLGLRGAIEGFSTFEMSIVMSAYFVGFLGGCGGDLPTTPEMDQRFGASVPDWPAFPDSADALMSLADGAIVGSWLKVDGRVHNPVDRARVSPMVEACKRAG